MQNILIKFANFIIDNIVNLLTFILGILPNSPFSNLSFAVFTPYLGFINWLIPVGQMVSFLTAWGTAVLIYYIYSVVMRFTQVID